MKTFDPVVVELKKTWLKDLNLQNVLRKTQTNSKYE